MFMRYLFLALALTLGSGDFDEAVERGEYKAAIKGYEGLLDQAARSDRSELFLKLAIAHLRDQEQERAFRAFLQALSDASPLAPSTPTAAEQAIYQEALDIYLKNTGRAAQKAAATLAQTYGAVIEAHPDYHLLAYLVALSLANTGCYEPFFKLFYSSCRHYPDHFLAFKTRALLHHKLMEYARDPVVVEKEKAQIWSNAQAAFAQNPRDISLHQMTISFAPADQKRNALLTSLNNIILNNMIVPRSDLLFFVKESGAVGEWTRAEQFLEKARSWYPESQILDSAVIYVQTRGKEG